MINNLSNINFSKINENLRIVKDFDDFKKVFGVFKTEPFYEDWSDEEMYEEFQSIKKNGEIIGYYKNNDIVGILDLIDGAEDKHPVKFIEPKNVLYISDIAVVKEARGKGYAKDLVRNLMLSLNNVLTQYDYAYLRTNLKGSMSERLFLPYGFETMRDENNQIIIQQVSFPRTIDIQDTDERKFLSKKIR